MSSDDLSWAFLFLVVVGLIVGVGIVVGMIVAGRIDALMAPRPRPKPEDPAAPAPGTSDAQGPDQEEHP